MTYILAIDQGTTSTRAVLFDRSGHVAASARENFRQIYEKPGWVEHDAEEIWETVLHIVQKATAQIRPEEIGAVGITNQRETAVLWDRMTGKPVCRAICWQSRQSDGICEALRRKGAEAMIREKTGLLIDPYFSATKLMWIFEQHPDLYDRAKRGELCFGTIDSWLIWNMTGGAVHATDHTNASRTLLYNIHDLCWDQDLLELFQIPAAILPQVQSSSGIFGWTDPAVFAGIRTRIGGAAGDQQAALFGQGCLTEGSAKCTYGTGAFLLMHTGNQFVKSSCGLLTTLACSIGGQTGYALEGSVFIAGSLMTWLQEEMQLIGDPSESETLAASVPDSGGVYIVPAFTGLGAPYWDMKARGAVFGLTRGTTKAHFVRAALESLGYQSRDIFSAMEDDSGIRLTAVKVDGGAAKNGFLMQFLSDLLGTQILRPEDTESTVRGAAYLAGLAAGLWEDVSKLPFETGESFIFRPEMKQEQADALYEGWKAAAASACTYHR